MKKVICFSTTLLIFTNVLIGQTHTGETVLVNPSGRTLLIEKDDDDSWLTFHDPGQHWFSMGIDRSNSALSINSGGALTSSQFVMLNNGSIGIGINSPQEILHIKQDGAILKLSSASYFGGSGQHLNHVLGSLKFNNYNAGNTNLDYSSEIRGVITNGWANSVGLAFIAQGNEAMRIKSNGNVGIGTTNPDSKLSVNGTIHTKEVKVDITGWSDFVFDNEYNLRTLEEVEQHIVEKGHLPDVPSEAEVIENGINLGEMDAKLLQKIEELTLYLLEQNKQLEKANQNILELQREVATHRKE